MPLVATVLFVTVSAGDYTNNNKELFNGNISSRVNAIKHFMDLGESPTVALYAYDQLNRLKDVSQLSNTSGSSLSGGIR